MQWKTTSAYGCALTGKLVHYQLPSSYSLVGNTLEPYQLVLAQVPMLHNVKCDILEALPLL